jgi:protein involved in polysaccharide export with SLBB domain
MHYKAIARSAIQLLVLLSQCSLVMGQDNVAETDTAVIVSRSEARSSSSLLLTLLDARVDPEHYVLGPGDRLDVSIFGGINRIVPVLITPGGEIVMPGIGVLPVGGLTITNAEDRVRSAVLRLYQNVGVHLTLASVRQFKVFVVGDVSSPGVRVASAATRVSEVLSGPDSSVERDYLKRNILVRRSPRDSLPVDLVQFRLSGRLDSNPLLREGDVVVVPVVNERVYVYGRVSFPGAFEFRPNDTLADLLKLANGGYGLPPDAADTVRVSRSLGPESQQQFTFTRKAAFGTPGERFILQPSDAVYVPRNNDREAPRFATIQGEVLRPGSYPIRPGLTTVRDLVGTAGGFQPDASLAEATIARTEMSLATGRLRNLRNVPPELLSSREQRLLMAGDQGASQNVIIDFQQLFVSGAESYDQALEAGDVLTVPKRHDDVTIVGAVSRSGLVHYESGQDLQYFISLAGGYTRKADRGGVTIIHANSGARLDASEVTSLQPGDLVIVPYKERRDYLRYLATTSSVVTTATGLILTFIALLR